MGDGIRVSTDKADIDIEAVRRYLNDISYWAKDRSIDTIQKSIEHSRCYSLLLGDTFIGFARLVTDYATFAYLCDVFVLPEYQGQGHGSVLLKAITEDAELSGFRHYLFTRDAFDFYRHFGFSQDEALGKKLMVRG
jgi:GNAT superfamily N-acetyltransferase